MLAARFTQASIAGGFVLTEETAVAVMPDLASPFPAVSIVTVAAKRRMADLKAT
jgi:hypothetical protein